VAAAAGIAIEHLVNCRDGELMAVESVEIRVRGVDKRVPATHIDGRTIVATGRGLKIAAFKDEELVEGELVGDPKAFLACLSASGLRADIFTFPAALDGSTPRLPFHKEWDNVAAAPTANFSAWWDELPQESRKNARRAAKRGLVVRAAVLDAEFLKGIKAIYDETPVRQGMRFWHYGKTLDRIRIENGTYPERSEFIGAYLNDELIGFMKFVYVDRIARIMQILAKSSHFDKRPMNAMIAKAVEVCGEKRMSHLIYSKFSFGNKTDSALAEFKRRNGFEQVNFPRYYVPLTLKGRLAIKVGLHRGILGIVPLKVLRSLLQARSALLRLTMSLRVNRGAHREVEKQSR
jgi:hypothetical protein